MSETDTESVFDDICGFHCHVCMELFSTDSGSKLAPAETFCGHYVCVECFDKLKKENGDKTRYNFIYCCSMCQHRFVINDTNPAKGFIALIAEVEEKKKAETQVKNKCMIKCYRCSSWVHIDKARVCKTCCETVDNLFPPVTHFENDCAMRISAFDDLLRRFIICPQCALENHREVNHHLVKYVSLKNANDVMDSEEKSASVLKTYRTIIDETSKIHREEMNNVINALSLVHNRAKLVSTSGECSDALSELQNQVEIFEIASEEFVPAARTYSIRLKEVTNNLNDIFPNDQ